LDAARADIGEIDRYITDDSPGAAKRVVLELIERMEGLADAPHRGYVVKNPGHAGAA
jgi:plasmid stabilization system protein ParE